MKSLRPLLVFGTRPEAIKMGPLVHACRDRRDEVQPLVCLTGQHREMLDQVVQYFEIEPDFDLDLMAPNQSLAELTSSCLNGLDAVIRKTEPDCVVGQGDTTSAMVASLAAFYHRVPYVHVEAGLRTGDLYSPWPEEFNRRAISLTAMLHCAPTETTAANLRNSGVCPDTIHVTGNTVIDALLWATERERKHHDFWQQRYNYLDGRPMVLVTAHRRENHGQGIEDICEALARLARRHADVAFVLPVHLNPNVQEVVTSRLRSTKNIYLHDPVPYPEFVWLLDRCHLVLSDSGGVQEEAPSLRKPVLVMRDTTERGEAVEVGAVKLVGTSVDSIVSNVERLLDDEEAYRSMQVDKNPFGNGDAAQQILDLMLAAIPRRGAQAVALASLVSLVN